MKKKSIIALVVALVIACLAIAGVAVAIHLGGNNQDALAGNTQGSETESESESEIPQPKIIKLMMTGDNLMHMGIVRTGYLDDGTRNYDFMFEPLKEHLAAADIKITNQETIFGGNDISFSGYPAFNSPTEIGDAIAKAGFNVVLHASNHSADRGINGINNSFRYNQF